MKKTRPPAAALEARRASHARRPRAWGPAIAGLLEAHDKVQGCEPGDNAMRVVLKPEVEDYSDLPKLLIENGIDLRRFTEEELDLESAFMALTKGTSNRM